MGKGVILLTGYEPFLGMKRNPSIDACRRLEGREFNGHRVVVEEIPMRYAEVRDILYGHLERHKPVTVICTGLSSKGAALAVERVAINLGDSPDELNFGFTQRDQPLNSAGPDAYFTTLPLRRILQAVNDEGVPAVLSNTAGTYGCNLIFYHLMDWIHANNPGLPAGFIHIPRTPDQTIGTNDPSMTTETASKGLKIIVKCTSTAL